ncbi:MFS transporter [bacterium]|nr:MFS transporter [bacterium]MBU1985001.1 MFS transporter [bacterium]
MHTPQSDQSTAPTKRTRSKFPQSFWVANTMEIFERLAWYGFFAVSSLYITGSVSEGALGFTSEQRGILQGVIPFILYLLPVVFGALGDRFGYKKTFIVAYSLLVPGYYLLGQFTAFGTFFMSFLFVAIGAAIFKPVVVGTVARTTDETNSSMGFGIFYMMVNVGGFVGPVVAGFVRVRYGWDWVFAASSFWIACNFIWLLLFYKEPTTEATSGQKRTLRQVFGGIVQVLGNGRFFIMVFGILLLLAISGRDISWTDMALITGGWIILNLLLDIPLRAREKRSGQAAKGLRAPMKLGNWKFALYLLILSGFWTSFNQIFLTHPEFIRDFVDTRDMVNSARKWFGDDFARVVAAVNEELLANELGVFATDTRSSMDERIAALKNGSYLADLDTIPHNDLAATRSPQRVRMTAPEVKPMIWELYHFKVRIPNDTLIAHLNRLPVSVLAVDQTMVDGLVRELRSEQDRDAALKKMEVFVSGQVKTARGTQAPSGARPLPAEERRISEALVLKLGNWAFDERSQLDGTKLSYALGGIAFAMPADLRGEAHQLAEAYRQVNPEYIINVDAGAIVIFQVLVSFLIGFIPPLSAMVIGIVISAIGIGMAAWTYTGWLVTLAIAIFAFGEMAASPKSQEYVGRIAPQQKVAMFMGFYFWTVALGNIFGGRLSGELYGSLARDAGRPDIMWIIFGGLGLLTAVILMLYDRLIIGKGKME